ncbi:MAG: hypothetical protein INQ03_25135 [Candidatus Heimdallarchaeota archaeon]|nr:hypothetical protein [Candidatus Heimdallarchaeota archaeon]
MSNMIRLVVECIESLPRPGDLGIVINKLKEYPDMGIDAMIQLQIKEFLETQPDNQAIYVEDVMVKSRHTCEHCGEFINNGYFKIIFAALSDLGEIDRSKLIVISYDSFHQMKVHTYFESSFAEDNDISELIQENAEKNPRDQIGQDELQQNIHSYSLDELAQLLSI